MAVTIFRCPTCERDVHLDFDDSPYCPVCSNALIEGAVSDDFTVVVETVEVAPDIYLG